MKPRPVSWYLRLTVKDQRGIVARVAEVIARHDINIDSLEQEPHMPKDRVSFVITVEPVSEPTIRAAVDAINTFEFMVEPCCCCALGSHRAIVVPTQPWKPPLKPRPRHTSTQSDPGTAPPPLAAAASCWR